MAEKQNCDLKLKAKPGGKTVAEPFNKLITPENSFADWKVTAKTHRKRFAGWNSRDFPGGKRFFCWKLLELW